MPSISVGQADNLLTAGSVSMPTYTNGSLTPKDYPCSFIPNLSARPVPIPLGSYDPDSNVNTNVNPNMDRNVNSNMNMDYAQPKLKENYTYNTQHYAAGEFSDMTILVFTICLLIMLIVCTYLSFHLK